MQSSGDEGVIVFSMGSQINAMESSMADMFAEAFAKMPQKILWKSAGDPPSFIPPNVKMAKWLPQNDVLGNVYCLRSIRPISFYFPAFSYT